MNNQVFGGDDDFIPDFEFDGSEMKEDDLKDSGGGVKLKGLYHLEVTDRQIVQEEGKAANLNISMQVRAGEHESEVGKFVYHRMYLQKNEYEKDSSGGFVMEEATRKDGSTYKAKKKTGRILNLEKGDKILNGHVRFLRGLGLMKNEDAVGNTSAKLPFSLLNPGVQCIALVGADGQIVWNKTYQFDDEEAKNCPVNEQALLAYRAGQAGMSQDAIDAI